MAQIIEFPDAEEREWHEWERAIRQACFSNKTPDEVVSLALPRIRGHWQAIFEPITLELPKRPVPGTLTKSQAVLIQALIDDSAALVLERLKLERKAAFHRLVQSELAFSQYQLSNKLPP